MTRTIALVATAMLWSVAPLAQPNLPPPGPERPPAGQPDTRIPERVTPLIDRSGRDASQPGVMSPGSNPDPGMTVMPPMPEAGTNRDIPPPMTPGGNPGVPPR